MLRCPRCGDECDERDMVEGATAIVCSECRWDVNCPRCGDECDARDMSEVDKAIVCSECRFDADLEDLSRWEEELAEGAH
jgi:hypothetical protein